MDLNKVIQDELNGVSNTEKTPLKVNINGSEITFDTVEDLNKNLTEALATVGSEYQQMKNKLAELEANQYRGQTVDTDDEIVETGKFSQTKFLDLLKENPVEAFDYVDTFRYGTEKPVEHIKNQLKAAEETRQEYEVNRWLQRHPEFPGQQYGKVLDDVRVRMNLPLTAQNLELAYQQAIQSQLMPDFKTISYLNQYKAQMMQDIVSKGGQLPPDMQEQYNQIYGNQQFNQPQNYGYQPSYPQNNPNPPRSAPPRLPNGGNVEHGLNEAQLDKLSPEQLRNILEKFGVGV